MKKFIKENWFLIGITLIVLLSGVTILFYLQTQQKESQQKQLLESSIKCNQDGLKFFDNYKMKTVDYNIEKPLVTPAGGDTGVNNPFHIYTHPFYRFNSPTYHLDKHLNTCLVSISYDISNHASFDGHNLVSVFDSKYGEIIDIYANKTIISTENPKFEEQKNTLMSE